MKASRFMVMALLGVVCVRAQADGIRIEPFTLAANEEKDIEILLDNSGDYGGLQFDLYLPAGVSIVENEDEELYERNGERLTKQFTVDAAQKADGGYRFLVYNTKGKNIAGVSGNAILTVKLTANDRVQSSTQQIRVKEQTLSTVEAEETMVADTSFPFSLTVETTIGAAGYATFSWPVALDFTGLAVEAYIATEETDGSLSLEPVGKVAAGTGVVLKGEAGTYTLQTTREDAGDARASLLSGTAYGRETVATDDVFVLANKSYGVGFYRAAVGLTIDQYKAYLKSASGARVIFFDRDISAVVERPDNGVAATGDRPYTLGGVRANGSAGKRIWIKGGKKTVVKKI